MHNAVHTLQQAQPFNPMPKHTRVSKRLITCIFGLSVYYTCRTAFKFLLRGFSSDSSEIDSYKIKALTKHKIVTVELFSTNRSTG